MHVLERVGVVEGGTDGNFAPMAAVTRAQTASLVSRALEVADLEQVRFITTNDFHGRIENAPFLSTQLNAIKDAHPNTLHVDAGDLVGATPVLSNLFHDEPTVEVMNAVGLAVQTVGNHEFAPGAPNSNGAVTAAASRTTAATGPISTSSARTTPRCRPTSSTKPPTRR